jgi:hypothetical protein
LRHTLVASLAALALAACGGGSSATVASLGSSENSVTPDRHRSWMSPDAKKRDLLYVSDQGTDDVYAYSYPAGKLKGTLTGFNEPYGLCTDKEGDIFIVNTEAAEILEYKHGRTSPIATLGDSGEYPVGCSVDPTTGNLAVTNFQASGSKPGSLAIYADAKGSPTLYDAANVRLYEFCGYDVSGNVFVDGYTSSGSFALAELPKGGSTFTDISLNTTIYQPGGVQWDGKYLAVGDQYYDNRPEAAIYQVSVAGSVGTVVNTIRLTQGSDDVQVVQFWKSGANVIAGNFFTKSVGFWSYPAGGNPRKVIEGLKIPTGSTVSRGR